MAIDIKVIWAAYALLLAALLPSGARADQVTWERCNFKSPFARVLGPLPDTNATKLSLIDCGITQLKPADFEGLPHVRHVTIAHNGLAHVDPAVFTALSGLRHLLIIHNNLAEIPNFGALSQFPDISKLWLSFNNISRLDNPQTFSTIKNLEILFLDDNHIEYIHPDIFKPLTVLRHLTLHNNRITYIPDKMFHIPSLIDLDLGNNLISYIAPGAIGSSNLKTLSLENNSLTYLPEHFVLGLKTASPGFLRIELDANPLQCGCRRELAAEAEEANMHYWYSPKEGGVACEPAAAAAAERCHRPSPAARAPPTTPANIII